LYTQVFLRMKWRELFYTITLTKITMKAIELLIERMYYKYYWFCMSLSRKYPVSQAHNNSMLSIILLFTLNFLSVIAFCIPYISVEIYGSMIIIFILVLLIYVAYKYDFKDYGSIVIKKYQRPIENPYKKNFSWMYWYVICTIGGFFFSLIYFILKNPLK